MATFPASVTTVRSISFSELLEQVYDAMMIDSDVGPSSVARQRFIVRAINTAYRYAWQYYAWPESKVYGPVVVGTHPVAACPFVPRQYQGIVLDSLYGLWTAHPLASPSTAQEIHYTTAPDGFYLKAQWSSLTSAWALYRPNAPKFSATAWSAATTYAAGKSALYTDGNSYTALKAVTTTPPVTDGSADANWQVQSPLYILTEAVACGAVAIYNRGEEKFTNEAVLQEAMDLYLFTQFGINKNEMGETRTYRQAQAA